MSHIWVNYFRTKEYGIKAIPKLSLLKYLGKIDQECIDSYFLTLKFNDLDFLHTCIINSNQKKVFKLSFREQQKQSTAHRISNGFMELFDQNKDLLEKDLELSYRIVVKDDCGDSVVVIDEDNVNLVYDNSLINYNKDQATVLPCKIYSYCEKIVDISEIT